MSHILPLTSIIITTHNRSKLLKNAIFSAINQTYLNIEIIIVDDCSVDNTEEVVELIQKKFSNVTYIKLPVQSGANIARNKGILLARGYFVTCLDDDDTMMPNRIIKLVSAYNDNFAYVCSQVFYIYPNKKEKKYFKYIGNIITLNDMLYTNFTGNQVLTTRAMYIQAGLYDKHLVSAQDYDMWLKLLLIKPRAKLVREPLLNISRSDDIERISTSKKRVQGYFAVYKKYKIYMNTNQRKFQLFRLLLAKNKPISMKSFIRYFSCKNMMYYLYMVVKGIMIGQK